MRTESTISTSVPVNESPAFEGKVDWVLLAAILLTLLNGLIISLWVFPAVSGPVGLATAPTDGWAEIAGNVVKGNGFVYDPAARPTPTTGYLAREPVYALFLASILILFGNFDPYVMWFQVVVNAVTCFVLYLIAAKVFNRKAALIACFLYAVYPFASWYVSRVAYETLLGLLVALLTLGLVNLFEYLSFRRSLIVGFLLGFTVLCKGTYLLLPFAMLPALMIRFGIRKRRVLWCWGVSGLTMLALLSPWAMRNYLVSMELVPVTTHGAIAFFYGDKIIESYSVWTNTPGDYPDRESEKRYNSIRDLIQKESHGLSNAQVEVQVDRELTRLIVSRVLSDPLYFLKKILLGALFVWYLGDTTLKSNALLLMQGPLVLMALFGMYYAAKANRPVLPLMMVLSYFVLVQTAFISLGRFSYPMVPILIAFAAYAVETFRIKYLRGAVSTA